MCTALANTYISAVFEQSFWGCLDIAVGRGDRLCSAIYTYIYIIIKTSLTAWV